MPEIKCPHCGEVFQVDESDYENIVRQIRDSEFNKDLEREKSLLNKSHEQDLEKERIRLEQEYNKKLGERDAEITRLNGKLENQETALESKNKEELLSKEKEINDLKGQLQQAKNQSSQEIGELRNQLNAEKFNTTQAKKDLEVQLKEQKIELESAHREEIVKINSEHTTELAKVSSDKEIAVANLENQIAQLKEYKNSRSVKIIGEDLEQYCKNEFEKVRHMGFKGDYFEKDNDASEGSKGDFIYRAYTDDGTEIVSIMFDMKDEDPNTVNHHKNEDFLDKLDKDRNKKGCEYAILVSTLEKDSDLYNQGIVDVSHIHDKMYVIRPEFFVPMITLLRNASLNSVEAKKEVAVIKQENVDMANFTDTMNDFYAGFKDVYQKASKKHAEAVEYIDKTIALLEKMKKALTVSTGHLKTAKNKIVTQGTPKALTKKSPSIANQLALAEIEVPDFDEPLPDDESDDYGDTSFLDDDFKN